jgi:hypothetical protein
MHKIILKNLTGMEKQSKSPPIELQLNINKKRGIKERVKLIQEHINEKSRSKREI